MKKLISEREYSHMKKILSLILVLTMVFALCACGEDTPAATEPVTTTAPTEAPTEPTVCPHEVEEVQTIPASCTNAGLVISSCTLCGKEFTAELPAPGHSFTAGDCSAPKTCTVCGTVSDEPVEHAYADATCILPQTCSVCGTTSGEALGHSYENDYCTRCNTKKASEGLEFKFRSSVDGYYVAGIGSCTDVNIIIPDTYDGYPVVYIDNLAFEGNQQIESIVLPETVFSIGSGAFHGCTCLKEVSLPQSLIRMGDKAFYGCTSLTSITLPGAMTQTGQSVFEKCTALAEVVISEGTTTISDCAFFGCTNLTTVILPSSLTQINRLAFYQCESLSSIVIPSSVTTVGSNAFGACKSLTGVFTEFDAIPAGWDPEWCGTVNAIVYLAGQWQYVDTIPTPKA